MTVASSGLADLLGATRPRGASTGSGLPERGSRSTHRFVFARPPPAASSATSPLASNAALARRYVLSAIPAAARSSSVDRRLTASCSSASAANAASSSRAEPRARLHDNAASNSGALISPSNHGPACANVTATTGEFPRPSPACSTTTSPRRTSPSRAARYWLRLNPARAAATRVPGQARCSRLAKLASENAAIRSPADTSESASAAAIAT